VRLQYSKAAAEINSVKSTPSLSTPAVSAPAAAVGYAAAAAARDRQADRRIDTSPMLYATSVTGRSIFFWL